MRWTLDGQWLLEMTNELCVQVVLPRTQRKKERRERASEKDSVTRDKKSTYEKVAHSKSIARSSAAAPPRVV